jgi:multiple sugar transport system permease protein
MFWAMRRIPRDALDAARLDGAGAFRIWWSVALPQVRPALLAVAVLSFERHWSNFIDPLLYISNQDRYTLPVALQALQQLHRTQWPLLMAGVVVVTLPAVLVFLFAQRVFLNEAGERGGVFGEE